MNFSRRDLLLAGVALGAALAAAPRPSRAQWMAPRSFGVLPAGGAVDQTAMLQGAIDAAAQAQVSLFLPPGIYSTRRLALRSNTQITGVPGKSLLRCRDGGALIGIEHAENIRLDGIVLDGGGKDMGAEWALLAATSVAGLQISNCSFLRSSAGGILVLRSEGVVIVGNIVDRAATGIAVTDGTTGGKPALVKGNLVRNLFFRKVALCQGNGIVIGADGLVQGNSVEHAPGFGILVPAAADVSITGNVIRNAHIGIGIPIAVADAMHLAGNRIAGVTDGAIRAMKGPVPIGADLDAIGIG